MSTAEEKKSVKGFIVIHLMGHRQLVKEAFSTRQDA